MTHIQIHVEGMTFTVKETDEITSIFDQLESGKITDEFVNLEGLHIRPSSILAWRRVHERGNET